jgi:autotransporter-associated beta strand protein
MNRTNHSRFGRLCRTAVALLTGAGLLSGGFPAFAGDNVLSFDANGERVVTTGRITAADFTAEAWVNPSAYIAENQILSQYDSSSGRFIVALRNDKAGMFIGGTWKTGTTSIPLNTWTHIAVTRVGSLCTIYVNGVQDWSGTINANALPNVGFCIGSINASAAGFRGLISDVRAWNTVRIQAQIAGAMNQRLTGGETGLAHYWKLNEGIGTVVSDSKAAANGTIYNASWAVSATLPIVTTGIHAAWTASANGNWSNPVNWLGGIVGQGANNTAWFTNAPPAPFTVANDFAGLLLGNMAIHSEQGFTFTGNAITFTNDVLPSRIVATNGAHTFGLPLATTAPGLILDTLAPASLAFPGGISGPGGVTVNPAASGGGMVSLADGNTFTGPTAAGCGTLRVATLTNGGQPGPLGASSADAANLTLGPGTFHYTGPSVTTDRGFRIAAGSGRAVLLRVEDEITFTGQVTSSSGAFIKTGPGTLRLTYPGSQTLCSGQSGSPFSQQDIGVNGDSPTVGFGGFNVNQGIVILGAPGQTNTVNGRILVGLCTTAAAGQETAGELIINDGVLQNPGQSFGIGWNNGTVVTAGPDGIRSKVTVNGGLVKTAILAVGANQMGLAGFNARPVLVQNGGTVELSSYLILAEHAGAVSRADINGGLFKVTGTGNGIRSGGGESVMTLSGTAAVDIAETVQLATLAGSKSLLKLDGGTLTARNITKNAGNEAILSFNGGTFLPHTAGQTLSGLTAAYVSTNGALIDTSLADYTVAQNLLHDPDLGGAPDGGFTKLGSGTLTLSSTGSTYTGPTLISGGVLRIAGTLPIDNDVIVGADGELLVGGSATQTLSAASLALEPGATLGFAFAADGTSNDRLVVADSPTFTPGSLVALYLQDSDLPFTRNGTYTLLTYPGAAPAVGGLACANPVFGKTYAFAASGGSVTVTIANDAAGASVWNVDADGDWADAGNWTVAPVPGGTVRFDDAITVPRTVATAGESAGVIYFNSPFAYTLDGAGLTLSPISDLRPLISVESGAHAVTAPLTLASDATVAFNPGTGLSLGSVAGASATLTAQGNGTLALTAAPAVQALALDVATLGLSITMTVTPPVQLERTVTVEPATGTTATLDGALSGPGGLTKSGSSILVPASANTYTGPTTVNAGTLRVASLANGGAASAVGASSAAAANLILGNGTLHITGASATTRGYTARASSNRAAVLRADGDVTFGGQVLSPSGAFVKTGPGTVTYTFQGTNTLNTQEVGGAAGLQDIGPYGDAPTTGFTGFTVSQGRIVLGAANQVNNARRIEIGSRTTGTGPETAGELVVNGGILNSAATVSVGRNNGTAATAPDGVSSRLTVNGGVCNFPVLASGNNGAGLSGYNARPVIEVTGGQVNVGGDYLSVGESPGSSATLLVSGGTVNIHHVTGDLRLGGGQSATTASGTGTARLSGNGYLRANRNVSLGFGNNGQGEFHLDGGTLSALTVTGGNGTRREFWFNGGLFLPHTANQTMSGLTAACVSTNGAVVDTSLADGYTVAQNLLHDPALDGARDGGLFKLGTNTLSLTSAANTFNGPVRVASGLLRARLGGTNDLFVAAGAAFDAFGERCTVGGLTGSGLLTNGTVAVTGRLDAGTNNAPAGASMTVQNLSLVGGSTFACDWATNSLGQAVNDTVAVTGTLHPEGPGFFDLGRTEANPVPVPFTLTFASYGALSGSFAGWKAVGTGLPPEKNVATVVTAADGLVTLELRYSGTLIMLQ